MRMDNEGVMEKTYRLTATAKVGGRYFEQGSIVSEDEAKKGHPSLISVGVVVPSFEEVKPTTSAGESDGLKDVSASREKG